MEKAGKTDAAVSTGVAPADALDSPVEVVSHLKSMRRQHQWDPNLPDEVAEEIDEAVDKGAGIGVAQELLDDSPYPEVRAAVANYDEGGHSNTIRAWTIGLVLSTIGSALNMLFSMRQPYITIPSYVANVIAYPIGVFWARTLPNRECNVLGLRFNLNPGPFSKKEHAIIVIMANATFGGGAAYATDVLLAQRAFYNQSFGWGFELLMCISTQMLGFGMAGFFTRFLVTPASMIWPTNLISTSLFTALHDKSKPDPAKTSGWTMGKYRFFMIVMVVSFVWYWFPGYIAPFLSVFAWVTWIRPNNAIVNQIFGGWTGLSLIPMTFDWTQISGFNFSPLIAPWHGIANTLIACILWYWIITPALHYSGLFYAKYLPISDSNSYDNTASRYNVSRIVTPALTFDYEEYKRYSPLFLSTTFALSYGLSFASMIALLVHTALFHGKDLIQRIKNMGMEEEDVHQRLMSRFKPVPWWWYGAVTLVMIGMALGVTQGYDTHLSWWAFFISLIIAVVWFVPCGMVQAMTNIQIGLNVITEFIVGYMQPGKPMAMMLFKTYGYISMYQGLFFLQDMKLGHYMKIPPRVTFMAQMISCLWSSIVQICVMNWALGSISGVCQPDQKDRYTCPNGRVFFNASIIWGVIGPKRIFSGGQIYNPLMYFFLAGFLLPIAVYLLARKWPRSPARYINAPIIFGGTGLIPPATPLNYLSWGIVGFIFNKLIRDRHRGWWSYYNFITSAALDVGLMLSTILIFLTLFMTNTSFPSWWGTSIAENTMDASGNAIRVRLAPGETFGPKSWS